MLKTERIIVNCANHKERKFDEIADFVRYLAWDSEYKAVKSAYAKMASIIIDANPVANLGEMGLKELVQVDNIDPNKFIETRERIAEIDKILVNLSKQGANKETYNALSNTDKVFLTLQAHTAVKGLKLDESILIQPNGEKYELESAIKSWFSSGQKLSDMKKWLSTIFSNLVKEDGILFHPVKIRKGDIADKDVRNFLASFGGKAKRSGKEHKGRYEYDNSVTEKQLISSITDLFAVILESDEIEVVKPTSTNKKGGEKNEK